MMGPAEEAAFFTNHALQKLASFADELLPYQLRPDPKRDVDLLARLAPLLWPHAGLPLDDGILSAAEAERVLRSPAVVASLDLPGLRRVVRHLGRAERFDDPALVAALHDRSLAAVVGRARELSAWNPPAKLTSRFSKKLSSMLGTGDGVEALVPKDEAEVTWLFEGVRLSKPSVAWRCVVALGAARGTNRARIARFLWAHVSSPVDTVKRRAFAVLGTRFADFPETFAALERQLMVEHDRHVLGLIVEALTAAGASDPARAARTLTALASHGVGASKVDEAVARFRAAGGAVVASVPAGAELARDDPYFYERVFKGLCALPCWPESFPWLRAWARCPVPRCGDPARDALARFGALPEFQGPLAATLCALASSDDRMIRRWAFDAIAESPSARAVGASLLIDGLSSPDARTATQAARALFALTDTRPLAAAEVRRVEASVAVCQPTIREAIWLVLERSGITQRLPEGTVRASALVDRAFPLSCALASRKLVVHGGVLYGAGVERRSDGERLGVIVFDPVASTATFAPLPFAFPAARDVGFDRELEIVGCLPGGPLLRLELKRDAPPETFLYEWRAAERCFLRWSSATQSSRIGSGESEESQAHSLTSVPLLVWQERLEGPFEMLADRTPYFHVEDFERPPLEPEVVRARAAVAAHETRLRAHMRPVSKAATGGWPSPWGVLFDPERAVANADPRLRGAKRIEPITAVVWSHSGMEHRVLVCESVVDEVKVATLFTVGDRTP